MTVLRVLMEVHSLKQDQQHARFVVAEQRTTHNDQAASALVLTVPGCQRATSASVRPDTTIQL
jgi:hypothetical protein